MEVQSVPHFLLKQLIHDPGVAQAAHTRTALSTAPQTTPIPEAHCRQGPIEHFPLLSWRQKKAGDPQNTNMTFAHRPLEFMSEFFHVDAFTERIYREIFDFRFCCERFT
jgi:hypothetical protein